MGRGAEGRHEGVGRATCMCIYNRGKYIFIGRRGSTFFVLFFFHHFFFVTFAVPIFFPFFFFRGHPVATRDTIRECTRNAVHVYAIDYFGIHGCREGVGKGGKGRVEREQREK